MDLPEVRGGLKMTLERPSLESEWPDLNRHAEAMYGTWLHLKEVGGVTTTHKGPSGQVYTLRATINPHYECDLGTFDRHLVVCTMMARESLSVEVFVPGINVEYGDGEAPAEFKGLWLECRIPPIVDGEWPPPGFYTPDETAAVQLGIKSVKPHPLQSVTLAEAPNHHADRDLHRALSRQSNKGAWTVNEADGFVYIDEKHTTFIYQPGEVVAQDWWKEELRDKTLELLDQRFRNMPADLVADVVDILFLHWYYNGKPAKARITLSQVVKYRGKKPLAKTLELHWRAIRDARSIRLRGGIFDDIALLEIDAIRPPQANLFGLESPPANDLVYIYSPGWFVAEAVGNAPFLAAYTQRVLELDPNNHALAKRLARYLRGEWRMNPGAYLRRQARSYRTWADHLANAGIDPKEFVTGRTRTSQFLDSLDDQLLALVRVGALRDWVPDLHRPDSLTEPFESLAALYHPEDRQRLETLPYHGRLEAFLSLRVHLPPPKSLTENLDHYAKQQEKRNAARQAIQQEAGVRKALKAGSKKPKAPELP